MDNLITKFKYVQVVRSQRYALSWSILAALKSNSAKIISTDFHWSIYKPDILEKKLWITYDSCVNYTFRFDDTKIYCIVKIFDGDLLGNPTYVRFTLVAELPLEFALNFKREIEEKFHIVLCYEYEEFLDNQKTAWILARTTQIEGTL